MFTPPSDESLIDKALNGSQPSWVKLVQRHETRVYNYCLRMTRNRGDAMDLMQEVFLAIYRHLPSWRRQCAFTTWMMRIAVNKTMDLLRQRQRSPQLAASDPDEAVLLQWPAPTRHDPDQLCEEQDHNRHINASMQALPPDQRLIVELKFFQQLTFDEIGWQTGVSVNTAKSRLYAALNKLKETLENRHVM